MRYIEVAAYYHGLTLCLKTVEEGTEIVFPCHAVVESAQFVLRVGRVAGDEEEVGHLEGDDSSLVVVLVDAYAVAHAEWLVLGEDGCTRIAFLVGIVPVGLVSVERQVKLTCLQLGFLQTEEVGIERLKYFTKAFVAYSAEAIDVPGDEFHISIEIL